MKKPNKNYHLEGNEQGKSLCGRKRVIIVNRQRWNDANELMKCKICNKIQDNRNN